MNDDDKEGDQTRYRHHARERLTSKLEIHAWYFVKDSGNSGVQSLPSCNEEADALLQELAETH